MKIQTNALVLLKKKPFFSIATFFHKIIFFSKKKFEKEKNVLIEERIIEYKKAFEEKKMATKDLTEEQIEILQESYQNQIQEIEHQIKLIEARNQMCRFRIRMFEKETR